MAKRRSTDDTDPDLAEFRAVMDAPGPDYDPDAPPSRWKMTEAQLLAAITGRCEQLGIAWVHIDTPHHNRRRQNMIGFPDLFLCGSRGVAYRELKREGPPRMRPEQTAWKYQLLAAGANWGIWQPGDLESGRVDVELEALGGF
jgi:hypothetical protein